ncbi:MAG: hypothetical protein ACRD1D_01440 [Acidimicrobiales bacterium]
MDWAKVDAPLASALAGTPSDEALPVFVQIDRSRADAEALDRLGLGRDLGDLGTASLSPSQLDALTDQEWVLYVRLSGRLRLLVDPDLSAAPSQKKAARGNKRRRADQDER